MNDDPDDLPVSQILSRGLCLKCPACGQGKLFKSYLKQQDNCPHCGESFEGISADDGPAWLTILVVGHIVVFTILHMDKSGYDSMQVEMIVAASLTLVLALIVLPFSKGLFIAALWWMREKDGKEG